MSRDEAARVALRRLARGTDGARGPGRSGAESTLPPTDTGARGSDERPHATESPERGTNTGEYDGDSTAVLGRAVAAVGDLDAAARFADGGGVDALAAALSDRRRTASGLEAEEGIGALRAFCAYERAAACGRGGEPESSGGRGRDEGGDGGSKGRRTAVPPSTSAADSPHL